MPAVLFFVPGINRTPLILSFLGSYTVLTFVRALVMKHHLPFETLFLGTLSSPSFFLFTFFMITDPATSPKDRKMQIRTGVLLAVLDLIFHVFQSYYTFFYAAFALASFRFLRNHLLQYLEGRKQGTIQTLSLNGWVPRLALVLCAIIYSVYLGSTTGVMASRSMVDFRFQKMENTGIHQALGGVYERTDPRVQHVIKWILSVGSSVGTADIDGDGLQDLAFTAPLMRNDERLSVYRNKGEFQFEKVQLPKDVLDQIAQAETRGLPTQAVFADSDNDGDPDLLVTFAFGHPMLLQNQLQETGSMGWRDVSKEVGLTDYANSAAATFLDVNRDGKLDLLIGNVIPSEFHEYAEPTLINLFRLPQPAFEGDRRMFNFMHDGWHNSRNGGVNFLYLQDEFGKFVKQDSKAWGLPETGWSLAVASADLNQDGFPDLYVANDFGPDDLYFNEAGKHFKRITGTVFGSISKDTYKGMNASIQDFDGNGMQDVYVSNVHHALQAEGSLLWMFRPGKKAGEVSIVDEATERGALNEKRFGWGAAGADFNNDGWIDIAQANGMVDDTPDKAFSSCPDYWYTNEKIARSPPSIHRYADMWGDIRGRCIFGKELNRLYLNRGADAQPQFVDAAIPAGLTDETNSRGMAAVDLDNDGRMDLVTTHMFSSPSVFQNTKVPPSKLKTESPEEKHSFNVQLYGNGRSCNREGIGSLVQVKIEDPQKKQRTLVKEMQVVDGLAGQGDRRLHFGFPAGSQVMGIRVRWCGQEWQDFGAIPLEQNHILTQL